MFSRSVVLVAIKPNFKLINHNDHFIHSTTYGENVLVVHNPYTIMHRDQRNNYLLQCSQVSEVDALILTCLSWLNYFIAFVCPRFLRNNFDYSLSNTSLNCTNLRYSLAVIMPSQKWPEILSPNNCTTISFLYL